MNKVLKHSFIIAALSTLFLACSDDDMVPTNTAPTISDQTFSILLLGLLLPQMQTMTP